MQLYGMPVLGGEMRGCPNRWPRRRQGDQEQARVLQPGAHRDQDLEEGVCLLVQSCLYCVCLGVDGGWGTLWGCKV